MAIETGSSRLVEDFCWAHFSLCNAGCCEEIHGSSASQCPAVGHVARSLSALCAGPSCRGSFRYQWFSAIAIVLHTQSLSSSLCCQRHLIDFIVESHILLCMTTSSRDTLLRLAVVPAPILADVWFVSMYSQIHGRLRFGFSIRATYTLDFIIRHCLRVLVCKQWD
jgi:hypothetical protein